MFYKYIPKSHFSMCSFSFFTSTSLDYYGTCVNSFSTQADGHMTFHSNIAAICRGPALWWKNCYWPTEVLMWESLQDRWAPVKMLLVLTTQQYWLCEWIMMTSSVEMSATPALRLKSSSLSSAEFEKSSPRNTKTHRTPLCWVAQKDFTKIKYLPLNCKSLIMA